MTNTRITDAEVFERRYPVVLREFSLRSNSGGRGEYHGGEGVVRDIEFRIPVQVSILSERRVFHPYGLQGGGEGACGVNLWVRRRREGHKRADDMDLTRGKPSGEANGEREEEEKEKEKEKEQIINLGGKNTAAMQPGERIIIITPGGGGWGRVVVVDEGPEDEPTKTNEEEEKSTRGGGGGGGGRGGGGGGGEGGEGGKGGGREGEENNNVTWKGHQGSWALRIAMQESA